MSELTGCERIAVKRAFRTGHFWSPDVLAIRGGKGIGSLPQALSLPMKSDIVRTALRSMSLAEAIEYSHQVRVHHGREPDFDGEVGPAMAATVAKFRCMVPDYPPPAGMVLDYGGNDLCDRVARQMQADAERQYAVGRGNWPGCHGVGDFHAAKVALQMSAVPSHLRSVFRGVLWQVREAYAAIGLRFDFLDRRSQSGLQGTRYVDVLSGELWDGPINIDFEFASKSDGWIGLAIVGQSQGCGSAIWCKYLASYRGGNTDEEISQQWVTLVMHELAHNCGLGHTRGGVLNPSIITGLSGEWTDRDPATPLLRAKFGGVPVPLGDDDPKPPGPPEQDWVAKLERRVDDLESRMLARDALDQIILQRLTSLEG